METQYKAFISYRHLPLDMELAKKIQGRIEHYSVPRALRGNGGKKLGKVFRDQDELPISGSLSDSISTALDNTEYLIVICTPKTKESPWVMSEIDYFIEKHDRDHVLSVLGEGTPEEAFPPQLTGITDENGDRMQQVEPLAANVVADSAHKRNRLFKTESLRILAALVGCSYDDLYKREQRYKKRRLASVLLAAALVVLGFTGMLVNRNMQIKENYEQALRSQSEYLAAESQALLEKGDRMGAISLAIAALPDEENDRPLVSQAEYALGVAAGAYYTKNYTSSTVSAAGKLQHASFVEDFIINDNGSLLVSLTENGVITGWDTASYKERWSLRMDKNGYSITLAGFTRGGNVIVWEDKQLICINADTGEQAWSVKATEIDKESSLPSFDAVWLPTEADTVVFMIGRTVYRLNGADGKTVSSFNLKEAGDPGLYMALFNKYKNVISPDGSLLAVLFEDELFGDLYRIRVVDLEKEEVIAETAEYEYASLNSDVEKLYSFMFINGDLYYITYIPTGYGTSIFYGMETFTREVYNVYCFDLQKNEVRWTSSHESFSPGLGVSLTYTADLTPEPILALSYSNHIDLIDAATGESRGRTEFDSAVLCFKVLSDRIQCVTRNGSMGTVYPDKMDSWFSKPYFLNPLDSAVIFEGFRFWVGPQNSTELVYYCKQQTDPSYTEIGVEWKDNAQKEGFLPSEYLFSDGIFAVLNNYGQSGATLLLGKADPAEKMHVITLPTPEYGKYAIGDLNNGTLALPFTASESFGVVYLDTETLEQKNYTYENPDLKALLFFAEHSDETVRWAALCSGGYESGLKGNRLYLCTFDETLKLISQNEIAVVKNTYELKYFADPVSDQLYTFYPDTGTLLCTDPHTGESRACGEKLTETVKKIVERGDDPAGAIFCNAAGDLRAFADEPDLAVIYREEEPLYSIKTDENNKIEAMEFSPDGQTLFIVENDGYMYRYSLPDGVLLGRTELFYSSLDSISWQYTEKGFIAVNVNKYMNLVYTDDWAVRTYVPGAVAYQEDADRFWYNSGSDVGYFPRHTVASLIEYGRSLLGGWEMTDQQKARYGLK